MYGIEVETTVRGVSKINKVRPYKPKKRQARLVFDEYHYFTTEYKCWLFPTGFLERTKFSKLTKLCNLKSKHYHAYRARDPKTISSNKFFQ